MTTTARTGPGLGHLWRLTDDRAVVEHACGSAPAREHGYCVDDVARALVVLCRGRMASPGAMEAAGLYLTFLLDAIDGNGALHNRMSVDGVWRDEPGVGDWWGRAVFGLASAAGCEDLPPVLRSRAAEGMLLACRARSPWLHSCAFALLGAGDLLRAGGQNSEPTQFVHDCVHRVSSAVSGASTSWPWPEPRLRYASAAIPESMMVAGLALRDRQLIDDGLSLLRFLLDLCDREGHLSVPSSDGRGPGDRSIGRHQQPIEVGAIADACGTAFALTGAAIWREAVRRCWAWFLGANDHSTSMIDWVSGGSYDGLSAEGPNKNQGAESTLAMLSTEYQALTLGLLS